MKLMIVDDDYQIREGMRLGVDWEQLGIDDVFTCANGIEAMEIFGTNRPDVILADVQMPGMTGLEMVTKIREITSETRVIFISAYSEFEYCRQALLLGADDYILKPIEFQKLEETIIKNVEVLRKRRTQENQYATAMLEQEVRAVYEGGKESGKRLCELLQEEYPFVKEGHFFTMTVSPDRQEKLSEQEQRERNESLGNLFIDKKNGVCLPQINDRMIFLVQGNPSGLLAIYQQTELKNKILYWNQIHGTRFGTVSAGISGNHDIRGFKKGYQDALMAYEYRFYCGMGSANIQLTAMKQEYAKEKIWAEKLIKAIQNSSFSKTEEIIDQWREELQKEYVLPGVLKNVCRNVFRMISKKEQILDFPVDMEKRMENCKFLDELLDEVRKYIYEYIWNAKHQTEQVKKYSNVVKTAHMYVHEHYSEPLTVSQIAKEVGKSANYFSATFKKKQECLLRNI